ncbi:MAG: zinc ribbon domain-containing protein [Clostridia bacterium]|nr:zinc ribbon domain-containing protein [Clostridia bacterium]
MKEKDTKTKFRIIGAIILFIAIACVVIGLVDFFQVLGENEKPKLFWLFFIGFPLLPVGAVLFMIGIRRELTRYLVNENADILAQNMKIAVDATQLKKRICECGKENPMENQYCTECGKTLVSSCRNCGKIIDNTDKYCPNCGEKL